ncbi:DinB family protein [Flavobacterium orientale]|uniref:DinB family protein n=1 Tax=Flavobacterium orientale TaxID=1756020 RepID=A0A917DCG4_9FLAO|nr:DinB family protein [Flavobacterium orientale]GGD26520.1 hypothetical protein GCM10011343_15930 [Flavobacterium orientale]
MRYLFILLLSVLFCPSVMGQNHDSLFVASALKKLENSKAYLLQVADMMPADQYAFRPTEEEMRFGDQLLHISSNIGWLCSSYLSDGTNPVSKSDEKLTTKDSIRAVVVRTYDYAIGVLKQFPSDALGDKVSFFAGPLTKLQIINLLSDHQTHHRGQLLVYLRLSGLTPPRYVGW